MRNVRIREQEDKLLVLTGKHGFVDLDFIKKFIYPDLKYDTIRKKLQSLIKQNYLIYVETFIPKGYTVSHYAGYRIYALGKLGLEYIEYSGIEASDNSRAILTSSPYRMYHQVQVATVEEILNETFNDLTDSKYRMEEVLNEKESYNEVLQHQPDALAIIQSKNTNSYAGLFIEVERSYATNRRLRSKLMNYQSAIRNRFYDEKLGLKFVRYRILFISQNENEYEELKNKLSEILQDIEVDVAVCKYKDFVENADKNIYELPLIENKKFSLFESESH